jgi:hypothetical protein
MARTLDLPGKFPLALGAETGLAPGSDLAIFVQETLQTVRVLIINIFAKTGTHRRRKKAPLSWA